MQDEYQLRTFEGKGILNDHLKKIKQATELFLSAFKGFRRDLAISIGSNPKYIKADFVGTQNMLAVPLLERGGDFEHLSIFFLSVSELVDGKLKIKFPWIINREGRKKILEEAEIIHKNLIKVSETAMQVHNLLKTASFEFDMFNGKNDDVGYHEADIIFSRDSLNVSMEIARAISERAVRFDIDIISKRDSVK